jgi:uncharacterized damage-inducible protein DinB
MADSRPTIETPVPTLIELLHGKGAHVGPVECIQDLSAEAAVRQPPGFAHSIWQLVCHMNYWMEYELKRIGGQRPVYPVHAAESWLAPSPAGEAEWRHAQEQLAMLIQDFVTLAGSGPRELEREIEAIHTSETECSSSVEAVLWQMVAHNSYHTGQIAQLRRALGLWPPPGGGDTW